MNKKPRPGSERTAKKKPKVAIKKGPSLKGLNIALQGGGSHGAFTWGVLDRLLEEDGVFIDGISGTSAGAMNAVVVADGLMKGGKDGARRGLREFWHAVSKAALFSPLQRTPLDIASSNWNLDHSPGYLLLDLMQRLASPYQFNPCNINPLRDLLAEQVDFERVRSCNKVKIFVSATNVRTGRVKVFNRPEITADMVMASACLPFMYQAVEIDGEAYWDGGYMGNPALFPFAYECMCTDVLIVQINPMRRDEIPKTAQEVLNRVNEITFNGGLMKELRSIEFVGRLLDAESVDPGRYRKMLIHMIEFDERSLRLNASSKLNVDWELLTRLHGLGRETASNWIKRNYRHIGMESSVDLRSLFM